MGKVAEKNSIADIRALLEEEGVALRFTQIDAGPYSVQRVKTSQCKVACPLGTDVKGYVGLITAGKFEESLDLIKETNPFPAICGRVCLHPCEPECRRGEVDAPIAIRALKRFVADYELKQARPKTKGQLVKRKAGPKVAIVGSGPAGLTAASDLARWGYQPTVFEALPVAGGMLTVGIPPFRLPREVIQAEIEAIAGLGVEIKTDITIENPERLLDQGYKAVFLATGAHKGLKLGLPGEDLGGSLDALSFLKGIHLNGGKKVGQRVVVIGAGYASLDAARTALRLGSAQVDVLFRRSKEELPYPDLAKEAEREGVKLHYHTQPTAVRGQRGRVSGVACVKTKSGPPDGVGRKQPSPVEDSEFVIPAETVIFAVHQEPDLTFLGQDHAFEISRWNTLVVEPDALATGVQGIFAGGDVISGPKSVIEAIAMGHKAARSIHRYLGSSRSEESDRLAEDHQCEVIIADWVPERKTRMRISRLAPQRWEGHFQEVECLPSEEQARSEGQRCLMCGPCGECSQCIAECDKKLLALSVHGMASDEVLVRVPWLADRFPEGSGPWEVLIQGSTGRILRASASPVVCDVWEELCRGCAECAEICEYQARKMVARENGVVVSEVDQSVCRGCGSCVAVCPTGASVVSHFTETRLSEALEEMLGALSDRKGRAQAIRPQMVGFACNWSAYPMLEEGKASFPGVLHLIRVMCLGSVDPGYVLKAFELGADGVLLLGCSPERCHYSFGNRLAETQFQKAQKLIHTLGIEKVRLRLEAFSSGEDAKLSRAVMRFAKKMSQLGPNPLRAKED